MSIWLASCKYAGAATKGSSVHTQKTVSSRRQRICASRYRLALSKQARRAPHQDADHHQVDEKGPQPGEIVFARHVADAEHRGGGERAADRAQAADRDDDQHVDEVSEGEGMVEPDQHDADREQALVEVGGAIQTPVKSSFQND